MRHLPLSLVRPPALAVTTLAALLALSPAATAVAPASTLSATAASLAPHQRPAGPVEAAAPRAAVRHGRARPCGHPRPGAASRRGAGCARPQAPHAPPRSTPPHPSARPAPPPAAPAQTYAAPALAPTAVEAQLLALINAARADAEVAPVQLAAGTSDVARRWSAEMARSDLLAHNPMLIADVSAAGSAGWHHLAENVGTTGTGSADGVAALFAAYMASQRHRDNILDPRARFVGIGTLEALGPDGSPRLWDTMDFTDSYAG